MKHNNFFILFHLFPKHVTIFIVFFFVDGIIGHVSVKSVTMFVRFLSSWEFFLETFYFEEKFDTILRDFKFRIFKICWKF
jgi:hypothetical protein